MPSFTKQGLLCSLLLVLLAGCSAVPNVKVPSQQSGRTLPVTVLTADTTMLDTLLAEAELAYAAGQTGRFQRLLLDAATYAHSRENCPAVHHILQTIYSELNDEHQAKAMYLRAVCAHPKDTLLQRIMLLSAATVDLRLAQAQHAAKAQLYETLLDWPNALTAHVLSGAYDVEHVWRLTQNIPTADLSLTPYPSVNAFIELAQLLRQYGLDNYALAMQLTSWQYRFEGHPLVQDLPTQITTLLASEQQLSTPRIAVLLPLSGRLAPRAEQIRQGILAAYFAQQHDYEIQFFDTHANSVETLIPQLSPFNVIVGPLLKDNVETLIPFLTTSQKLIALNRIPTHDLADLNQLPRFYFALAPEDEAEQIAEHVFQSQYLQPIMIHANDSVAVRMAEAFKSRWQSLTQRDDLMVLNFTDNASMRQSIIDTLGVGLSKARATTLERYLGSEVFSVTRNRRDVDAFVVFANPEQTELINPMIEASISSFSDEVLPVYATSRSYNHQLNKNSLRDLRNVNFIDIPWLLEQQNTALYRSHDKLYPTSSTTDKRLFAFGYDAYALIFNAHKLAQVEGLVYPGLTGEIYMNRQQNITRFLPKVIVSEDQILLQREQ